MAEPFVILERAREKEKIDFAANLLFANRKYGKSVWSQFSETIKLSFGRGRLHPREYYYFGLYDDEKFSYSDKTEFIGGIANGKINKRCNSRSWWVLGQDKLMLYGILQGMGVPIPRLYALYDHFRTFGTVPTLRGAAQLAEFLRQGMTYPFFSKPSLGTLSLGIAAVQSYDPAADCLVFSTGGTLPVEKFAAEVDAYRRHGYIFQELLRPHPDLTTICGDRLSTARVVVLVHEDGPRILHAVWKIPVGQNPADNFWRTGNMLGLVDATSGRVTRVVQGFGPDRTEVEVHPDTGQPVTDITLPEWPAMTRICLSLAAAIPGLRIQAWDMAMTVDGAVPLEVNVNGDFSLAQLASGKGLLSDDHFNEFYKSRKKK